MNGTVTSSIDKSSKTIQDMFAGVAPRYDLLNRVLSGSLDVWWRRQATKVVTGRLQAGDVVLDLCCGTGDQAASIAARGGRVVAADFCLPMLALARGKLQRLTPGTPRLATADAMTLPFPDDHFAAVTASFGLRNVASLERSLEEIHRVLRPGGQAVFLEFALPEGKIFGSLYLFYFRKVLPRIGSIISPRGSAYNYLPDSVEEFPQRRDFTLEMDRVGFSETGWRDLSGGTVCLYVGLK